MDAEKESSPVVLEGGSSDGPKPPAVKWFPSARAFSWYSTISNGHPSLREQQAVGTKKNLVVLVTFPLVVKLTKDIVETYQTCNPAFTYSESFNPKRCLTNPSASVSNDGLDNENSDLILSVNGVLINTEMNHRYIVKEMLGQGTFGQVVKCWGDDENCFVAVKVIKNQPAYYHQALVEISILNMLNYKLDPEDKHHLVRILDHFVYHRHLCIVFEMLGVNLYELLKVNALKGISLNLLRLFSKQILMALIVLREASVIHCDLKPENILLTSLKAAEIKLIDFGSACMENRTVYSYIQSRFYRSPEVVLGYPYTTAIDMWSFGCVAAELFLGLPLFPGASQYDLLQRMFEILGNQPPDHMLRKAKNTHKYFKHVGAPARHEETRGHGPHSAFQFLTLSEYEAKESEKPAIEKRYFPGNLEQMITDYPIRKKMPQEDMEKENLLRLIFVDFLKGLLHMDPLKRWTPWQAAQHPFITEKSFTGPFKPPSEAPRLPIPQGMTVDHNPISGHWFGAGLSPQVAVLNSGHQYSSPQHQGAAFSYASSYGSIGSYGSFGDAGGVFGGSYGSYTGASGLYADYQTPGVANTGYVASPDRWRRMSQAPPSAFGPMYLGMSPSSSLYRPMSLGASPSQFAAPSSQFQASPGSPSTGSPSRYGPTSPARGSGVTTLGKAAVVGQYRRRGWGSPGSAMNTVSGVHGPSHDNMQGAWHGIYSNAASATGDQGSSRSTSMQGVHPALRHRNGAGATAGPVQQSKSSSTYAPGSLGAYLSISETASEGGDNSSSPPDPADWDPNYSEEQLLQEDGLELASPTGTSDTSPGVLHLGLGSNNYVPGSSLGPGARLNRSFMHCQGGSPNGVFSPPSMYGLQSGYGRKHFHHGPFSPQQNSPSRLGQHSQLLQQHLQYPYYAPSLQSPDQPVHFSNIGQQQSNYRYSSHTFQSPDQAAHIPAIGHGHVVNNESGSFPSQWDGRGNLVMDNSGTFGSASHEYYPQIIAGHPGGPSIYKSVYGMQTKDHMLQAQDNTSQRLSGFPPPQGPNVYALESPGRRAGPSSMVLPPTSGRKDRWTIS